jgi:hypothetical protein
MGYHSEVGLCLAAQAQAKLESCLLNLANSEDAYSLEEETAIREFFNVAEIRKDEVSGVTAYYWPRSKWYSDYPEMRFIENFLNPLDAMEYYFLRLGDDEDDTEVLGGFWENPLKMALHRSISFA